MPSWLNKWIVLCGLVLILVAGYSYAARQEVRRTPIQELEAVIARYKLTYAAETDLERRFVVDEDTREIHVCPSWAQVELHENGGAGVSGITAWNVSVFGWNVDLQQALLDALNESPAAARQLAKHRDERIQFLLLKVLYDWGRDAKTLTAEEDGGYQRRWELKPHAVEALLELAERDDPHAVGTVISALNFKGRFSADVFFAAMGHPSSEIRAEALRWLNPERHELTTAEIRAVAPVLIEHLADRDLVVREWSMTSLQSLVAYWENSLGGAPIDVVRTDQSKMVELPIAPASGRWHREVFPQMSEQARKYRAEWEAWLAKAEQSL